VFSEDGELTLLIPNGKGDEMVKNNVLLASATSVLLLENPEIVELMITAFAIRVREDLDDQKA
jgi:hypothetical protein